VGGGVKIGLAPELLLNDAEGLNSILQKFIQKAQ